MQLSDFDYTLPEDRIAQTPIEPRDHSKLLVLDRETGKLQNRHFYDLIHLLTENDVLVLNNTKVFPARLILQKQSGKSVELLLEKELTLTPDSITFEVLTKPGLRIGETVTLPGTKLTATCTQVNEYTRNVTFNVARESLFAILNTYAQTPIPPYIHWEENDETNLRKRYQTVYAKFQGAVAAPTAGLHFTSALLQSLADKGVQIEYVTLHVGLGTFLPVKSDDITEHQMHSEWFELDEATAERLTQSKSERKRIIAVGTTSIRVLETCAKQEANTTILKAQTGSTQIFIYPPYKFKFVDALLTNFHTPKSTLLMLVSALVSKPNSQHDFLNFKNSSIGKAYEHALENNYRFYSFGDAMFLV